MKLGRDTEYPSQYDPSLIDPIPREQSRSISHYDPHIFHGEDLWTIYEFSHLLESGIPSNAILSLTIPSTSKSIPESKSLKLYFNSLNQLKQSFKEALSTVGGDTESALSCNINIVKVNKDSNTFHDYTSTIFTELTHDLNPSHKKPTHWTIKESQSEWVRVYTPLFRSNCPVTNQPDWASIFISMSGKNQFVDSELLSYLLSFRNHQAFHESCVEEIIMVLKKEFDPEHLAVYARFTRRGGIDINPYRYYGKIDPKMAEIINLSKQLKFWDPRQ